MTKTTMESLMEEIKGLEVQKKTAKHAHDIDGLNAEIDDRNQQLIKLYHNHHKQQTNTPTPESNELVSNSPAESTSFMQLVNDAVTTVVNSGTGKSVASNVTAGLQWFGEQPTFVSQPPKVQLGIVALFITALGAVWVSRSKNETAKKTRHRVKKALTKIRNTFKRSGGGRRHNSRYRNVMTGGSSSSGIDIDIDDYSGLS